MGRRLAIPRLLSIDWWWILIIGLLEFYARYLLHVPDWVPSIAEIWILGQMLWLKLAEPSSIAIYFCALWCIADAVFLSIPRLQHMRLGFNVIAVLLLLGLNLAAIFVFRAEMVRHFRETEPRNLQLGGVMTFFFNELYFQYWFHQLYLEQNALEPLDIDTGDA